jgi:hypothetical protein
MTFRLKAEATRAQKAETTTVQRLKAEPRAWFGFRGSPEDRNRESV